MGQFWAVFSRIVEQFRDLFLTPQWLIRLAARWSDVPAILFCVVLVLVGGFLIWRGYRILPFVYVVTALGAGITLGYGVVMPFVQQHSQIEERFEWLLWLLIPLVLSLILGFLLFKLEKFAFFSAGALVGFYAGHWFASTIRSDVILTIVLSLAGSVLFGFVLVALRKKILQVAMGLGGSMMMGIGAAALLYVLFGTRWYRPSLLVATGLGLVLFIVLYLAGKKADREES